MLRQGTPEEVVSLIKRMQGEAMSLAKNLAALSYFMRGGLQFQDAYWLTYSERQVIQEFLDERFEIEKNNEHPQY